MSLLPNPTLLLFWYATASRRYWIGVDGLAIREWCPSECVEGGW